MSKIKNDPKNYLTRSQKIVNLFKNKFIKKDFVDGCKKEWDIDENGYIIFKKGKSSCKN